MKPKKPKRTRIHPLLAYLRERGLSYRDAAPELKCHFTTLHHICTWRSYASVPIARRIVAWSGGRIGMDEIYQDQR